MNDRELGLGRRITRRDFVQGVAVPVGGSLVLPPVSYTHLRAHET